MIPNIYVTNHPFSQTICAAFAQGCNGRLVSPARLLKGPAVVYGILRGCGEIIQECEWLHRDYYHIDHGYIGRGNPSQFDGYYRVSKNGLQADPDNMKLEDDVAEVSRFERLNTPIPKWRKTGKSVVVAPIAAPVAWIHGITPTKWVDTVMAELPNWTERPVIIKPKDGRAIAEVLADAWCLVTYSSNTAIDAIMSGVPAIVLGPSAAEPVSWFFEDIEKPIWPELVTWLHWLAWQQWTLAEMRSGEAWSHLKSLP